ncbi:hypothetical protein [uncultured Bacteroides sp.]|uniref:hypothetical protein n=1 Tax=uncultured Bacteroides sp. TaxID=162156 RepID=UPI0026242DDB|nr:hypothetical protein [uncultured Bacteroides sp.]
MKAHPIIDYPYRWFPTFVLALTLAIIQAALAWGYAFRGSNCSAKRLIRCY